MAPPQPPVDEDVPDWDELLTFIQEKKVVPIVGRELLPMAQQPGMLLDHHLAQQLAAELQIDLTGLTPQAELRQVAFRYLERCRDPNRIYSKTKTKLDQLQMEPPEPLRQLAAISSFDLFISTTFDGLLGKALDDVRFGGQRRTLDYAFSPFHQREDIPPEGLLGGTAVYRLFGKASFIGQDFALTEEDVLEFMHALQSETRRPQRLFDLLRERHLLFLGCGFPDWLARFFIRTLKTESFFKSRKSEFVVDHRLEVERDLVVFLKHFNTRVIYRGGAAQFVAELHNRWSIAQPLPVHREHARRMPDGAVFLSYASEDAEFVRRVHDQLGAIGVKTWLDRVDFVAGDHLNHVIQDQIRRCALFLPFLSRRTQVLTQGYFHAEWRQALQRALQVAPGVPFILPIAVDDTGPNAPFVPPEFEKLMWTRLEDGKLSQEGLRQLRDAWRKVQAPQYHPPEEP